MTKVEIRNSTVAYIEGNHLVVRLEDGRLEAIRIPEDFRFEVEGQQLALHELKPGMTLTEETITTTKPTLVETVEVTDATVMHVTPTRLVLRTREGKFVNYRVPDWDTIIVNGKEERLHSLHSGDKITATITTLEPKDYVNQEKRWHGHYAAAPAVEPKRAEPAAKVQTPEPAQTEQAEEQAQPETAPETLPSTASNLPLIGLLGLLSLSMGFGIRLYRKSFNL